MNSPPLKPLSAASAYKCEWGIEKGRCLCRCEGKFHGAQRRKAPRDDPHAAAFYCPCCGAPRRTRQRNEWLHDRRHLRKVNAALRKLDPWRNPPDQSVARLPLSEEELYTLSVEQLRELALAAIGKHEIR